MLSALLLGGFALGARAGEPAYPSYAADHKTVTAAAADTPPAFVYLRDLTLDPSVSGPSPPLVLQAQAGDRLWLVQFPGPIQEAWYAAITHADLEVIAYIPTFTYLVWGDGKALSTLRTLAPVSWWSSYSSHYALHPALRTLPQEANLLTVAVQTISTPETLSALKAKGRGRPVRARPGARVQTWRIEASPTQVREIARLPGVVNVEPVMVPALHDEVQAQILIGHLDAAGIAPIEPGYLHWLTATAGMTTTPNAYPIVDVTDDGIDDGDATPTHPDFYRSGDSLAADRLVYNANWTGDLLADSQGGHGTLNAAIVAGYNNRTGSQYEDGAGFNYGLGINPFGRVAGSKVFNNSGNWADPDYTDLIANSYQRGARISSNSWGALSGQGQYRIDDQTYDSLVRDADPDTPGYQPMVVVFSAGNSGPTTQTVGSPGNAKNVITVGAAESVRPNWRDGCGFGSTSADNANDIAPFSGRGPTADGRVKPDLVAPGTHIIAAASQTAGYTGRNVCDPYYPLGQTLYAASSGTSHAAPAVAGAASLLSRRYYEWMGSEPSPAMVKAMLLNGARYLDGVDSGDTLPSYHQGHGEVDLAAVLSDSARIIVDQSEIMRKTGETYVIYGHIDRADDPVRVTLAWTDAPGSTVGAAYVNDLDLSVEISGTTYLGNVFEGAYAKTGGTHDRVNNVESVFISPGAQGPLTLTVRAYNLAGDGVPGDADPTDQDFALICSNCEPKPAFNLEVQPPHIDLCASDIATYTVTSYARGDFSSTVPLQVTGTPTGTVATFSPNPVPADTSSRLTLSTSVGTPRGPYVLTIVGTSASITESITATLQLSSGAPVTPSLKRPQDGMYNVTHLPTFEWSPTAEARTYRLEIARTPTLDTLVYSTTVDSTRHTLAVPLDFETQYYWRIIPLNPCAEGPASTIRRFTTQMAPMSLCQDVGRSITDLRALTTTLIVSETLPVLDLDVALAATHSWVGDLVFTLTHEETGIDVLLFDRPGVPDTTFGCGGENLDILLDDDADTAVEDSCASIQPAYAPGNAFRPNGLLSATEGYGLLGRWTLTVADRAEGDQGTLDRWCLIPTLMADESIPGIAFDRAVYRTSILSGTMPINLRLSETISKTVTVRYATQDGTAVAGIDYLTSTGTLTFPVGVTAQSLAVPVLSSTLRSVTRTLILGLSTPRYAVLTAPLTTTLHLAPPVPWTHTYLPLILIEALTE